MRADTTNRRGDEVEEFIKVFGDITVGTVVVFVAALVFIWKLYTIIKNHLVEKYKQEEEKERKVREVIEQAKKYPEWHQQSLDIQKQFSDAISSIESSQRNNLKSLSRLETMIAENEATTCRYRILRFNDEILHGQRHTKEHFDQILEDITRYEKYCEGHPEYENNKAVLAIDNITRVYRKCSDENAFL